jgi:hypothetical protein
MNYEVAAGKYFVYSQKISEFLANQYIIPFVSTLMKRKRTLSTTAIRKLWSHFYIVSDRRREDLES